MLYSASLHFIRLSLFALCASIFINAYSTSFWTEHFPTNVTRLRRQATCGSGFVQCTSGECISEDTSCDGKEDCKDGSDEENCSNIPCNSPFLFRCDYGGCISRINKCDGKQDCKDNSDEANCNRTALCGANMFLCKNGQCIDEIYLCDGNPHCKDNSDETEEACKSFFCPGSTFRCNYGGCVSIKAKCNTVKECFDGSDELGCDTSTVNITTPPAPVEPPSPGSCLVPNNPPHGTYKVGEIIYQPGFYVPTYSALVLKCDRLYNRNPPGSTISVCNFGVWTPPPPTCALACEPKESTTTRIVNCKFNNSPLDNCLDPIEGVEAEINCAPLHEAPGLDLDPYRKCKDGSWDNSFPKCTPICGQKSPKGVPQIIAGKLAKKGDYPWHVGIFKNNEKKDNICGGSIISDNVVVSAAHCFSSLSNGQKFPPDGFLVAAGKYYINYEDDRDAEAQYTAIQDVHIPIRYRGEISQYEADIAVVILKTRLNFTSTIQPVCVDWAGVFEYRQIFGKTPGVVVGWGQTVQGDKPSEELKELAIPVIPYEQCFDEVPKEFRRFLTHDKVCAGYLKTGQSTCQGDSGGGLSFLYKENNRYFIRGVVSTSPATQQRFCDSNQYSTYTLISEYSPFIRQFI